MMTDIGLERVTVKEAAQDSMNLDQVLELEDGPECAGIRAWVDILHTLVQQAVKEKLQVASYAGQQKDELLQRQLRQQQQQLGWLSLVFSILHADFETRPEQNKPVKRHGEKSNVIEEDKSFVR